MTIKLDLSIIHVQLRRFASAQYEKHKTLSRREKGATQKGATRWLLGAQRRDGSIGYALCWEGDVEELEGLTVALLAVQLDDAAVRCRCRRKLHV